VRDIFRNEAGASNRAARWTVQARLYDASHSAISSQPCANSACGGALMGRQILSSMVNKRHRRTRVEIDTLRQVLLDFAEENKPCSTRQLFYLMVSNGFLPKLESEYNGTVIRLCGEMRESGDMPWSWITDATRWMRKPPTYSSLADAARDAAKTYRRDLWQARTFIYRCGAKSWRYLEPSQASPMNGMFR